MDFQTYSGFPPTTFQELIWVSYKDCPVAKSLHQFQAIGGPKPCLRNMKGSWNNPWKAETLSIGWKTTVSDTIPYCFSSRDQQRISVIKLMPVIYATWYREKGANTAYYLTFQLKVKPPQFGQCTNPAKTIHFSLEWSRARYQYSKLCGKQRHKQLSRMNQSRKKHQQ